MCVHLRDWNLVLQVHGYSPESEVGGALFGLNRQLVLSPHLLEISAMEVNVGETIKPHTSPYSQLLASTTKALPAAISPPTDQGAKELNSREHKEAEGTLEGVALDQGAALPRRMLEGDSSCGQEETHVRGLRVHVDATCPICLVTIPAQGRVCKQITFEFQQMLLVYPLLTQQGC